MYSKLVYILLPLLLVACKEEESPLEKSKKTESSELKTESSELLIAAQNNIKENKCKDGIDLYKKSIALKNKDAMAHFGKLYLNGQCTKKNIQEAAKYFKMASENNSADGQNNLGVSYAKGEGVSQDFVKAFESFKMSAEQGWSEAQFNLAICYEEGLGVEENAAEAKAWFEKSILRGVNKEESKEVKKYIADFKKSDYVDTYWIRDWSSIRK